MTDSHTRKKLWGDGLSATVPLQYQNSEFIKFKKHYQSQEPNKNHNYTRGSKKIENDDTWLVFLLSFGLQQTATDLNQMTDLGNGNHFLRYGKLEDDNDKFCFPKSVCSTKDGIIIVTDTGNNRIVAFNTGGVQLFVFDTFIFTDKVFTLSTPLSTCGLVNGNIAICNYENSTINIISPRGTNRLMFACRGKPISIDGDRSGTLFVLTEYQEIEEFSKSGKIIKVTKVSNNSGKIYTIMAVASLINEIYLGKCDSPNIFIITKNGESLRSLTLIVLGSGMNIFLTNFAVTEGNGIIVTDSVNRSVHLFNSDTGEYKTTLINGKSGLGCVQSACLTKDNLIVTSEYSLTQKHSVKIFSCTHDFNV